MVMASSSLYLSDISEPWDTLNIDKSDNMLRENEKDAGGTEKPCCHTRNN